MKKLYIPLLLVALGFLSNCKKEGQTAGLNNSAKITTRAVVVYPDGGVTLNGQINSVPTNMTEYGFLISTDSLLSNPLQLKISLPEVTGPFTADLSTGLVKNKKYFVAAYSIISGSAGFTIYNTVSFKSAGSKNIRITSVLPLKADLGDTITIHGKYFTGQYLSVLFGNARAFTVVPNDSVITCVVPASLTQVAPVITVQYASIIDTASTKFSLNLPVITSFTPIATFRDTVLITGAHLGSLETLSQVSFGSILATIISGNRTQLKVLVPDNIQHSFNSITVGAQLQTVTSTSQFQVRPPLITSATLSGNVNDPVTVTGKYFSPVTIKNTVYSEGNLAQLNSGNTRQLTYSIPNGPYPRRKATIKLQLLDYTVTYTTDMSINDRWIMVSKVPFDDSRVAGAFTINNVSYVVAATQDFNNAQQYLWRFNTGDFSWQQLNIPFACTNATLAANGNKAYLYLPAGNNNFYEFNPSVNIWTEKADYPAGIRLSGTLFAAGTKVDFGLGGPPDPYGGTPPVVESFYEYDINGDSWVRTADYPDPAFTSGARIHASAFVINTTAYVGCGATTTGMVAFYSYSTTTGTWTRIQDFPDARFSTGSFAYGNSGFIADGGWGTPSHDCFKYDQGVNTWTELKDYIGCVPCGNGLLGGYAFVNNGNVYFGGTDGFSYYLYQAVGSGL